MLQMQQSSIFADSPSFNSYSSDKFAEIAVKVSEEFSGEREEFGLESIIDHQFHHPVEGEEEEMASKELQIIVPEEEEEQQQRQKEEEEEDDDQKNKKVEETKEGGDGDGDDDDDFEFAFVCRDQDGSPITADEIFSNGQIKPFFPVFNRDLLFDGGQDDDDDDESKPQKDDRHRRRNPLKKLLIEDREPQSSSSSEADELEGLPEGTYCVWTPKPVEASLERCKKSSSTGTSRRWRFRDFLFRSNSDGKDTFIFLTPSPSKKKRDEKSAAAAAAAADHHKSTQVSDHHHQERKLKSTETNNNNNKGVAVAGGGKTKGKEASAHEIHYIRNRAMKEGDKRRSYLPYRQDLVGIFSNVNGLSRNLHPF